MASFLESVGVALLAAFLTVAWHMLSSDDKPELLDFAMGFDLLVAAGVVETGFMPGSQGWPLVFRWVGLVLIFVLLTTMAVVVRMYGYRKGEQLYRRNGEGHGTRYLPAEPQMLLKGKAALITSMVGCGILCGLGWLNLNIGLVVGAWKGALH